MLGRKKRIWEPGYFYHIVCRGNRREDLFLEQEDFLTFLYILEHVYQKCPFEVASYCLMTNHVHLQLRSQEQEISKVMARVNKRYADYFNYKYKLTGHVFEKRFFDRLIANEESMLETSRYIHLNPLEANIVSSPQDYAWSSLRYYFGKQVKQQPPYMNMDVLLDHFSGTKNEKGKKYHIWCLV
ncbi:transposase [Virgibacillus sp. MSP4-1]|uniref:REP-associated tyrosine transposase n=1 Tax=Virgibacillus sp. MSP4-1 TaxID=2700081 RepID=UPI00351B0847